MAAYALDRQGVDADYACRFKMSQSTGWKQAFVFKVVVCIDGVFAEEELRCVIDMPRTRYYTNEPASIKQPLQ